MFNNSSKFRIDPLESYSDFLNWADFFARERAHAFFRFNCAVKTPKKRDFVNDLNELEGGSKYDSPNHMSLSYNLPEETLYQTKPAIYWVAHHMISINHEISHLLDYKNKFQKQFDNESVFSALVQFISEQNFQFYLGKNGTKQPLINYRHNPNEINAEYYGLITSEELLTSMYPNSENDKIDKILIEIINDKIVLSKGGYPLRPTQTTFYTSLEELKTEYPKLIKNSYRELYTYNPFQQIENASIMPPDRMAEIMMMPDFEPYAISFLKETNVFEQIRKGAIILCFDSLYAKAKARYGILNDLPLDANHFNKSFFTKRAELARQAKLGLSNIKYSIEEKIDELDWH